MTTPLTTSRRKQLRKLARDYKPGVQIGKNGLNDAALAQVDAVLGKDELLKVRILDNCPMSAAEAGQTVAEACGAELVAVIGSTAVLYRANPELPQPKRIRFEA